MSDAKPDASAEASQTIVVDLGKKKRKQVKKLRKGEGKLMAKVQAVVEELRADGTSKPGDTVVVVVEKRERSPMKFRW